MGQSGMKFSADPLVTGAIIGALLAVVYTLLTGWWMFEIRPFGAAGTMIGHVAMGGGCGLMVGALVSFMRKH
jgi:hypothetical protein